MKATLKSKRNGGQTLRVGPLNRIHNNKTKSARGKFTDQQKVKLLEQVGEIVSLTGKSIAEACKQVGIHPTSYHFWKRNPQFQAGGRIITCGPQADPAQTTAAAAVTVVRACPACSQDLDKVNVVLNGVAKFCPACGLPMTKIIEAIRDHNAAGPLVT
jgi:transposase-like protein